MQSVCPYCRCEVQTDTPEAMVCEGCDTPHHRECYEENNGCTLFGCRFAPPDDPKVHISAGEASQAAVFANVPGAFNAPTGFGDVNAPVALGSVAVAEVTPPPPPPPGTELRSAPPADPLAVRATPADNHTTLFSAPVVPPKARLTFILLGIFLGSFGAHNFYARYYKRAIAQLALTVCTLFYGSFVTWIWALVEVCTVERDGNNNSFA